MEVETVLVHHTSSLLTSPPPPSTVNNEATWHATSLQQCNCQWEFCCWNLMHLPVISGGCVVPAVQLSLRGVRSETRQLTIYTVLLTPPWSTPGMDHTVRQKMCYTHKCSLLILWLRSAVGEEGRGQLCQHIDWTTWNTSNDGYRLCFPLQNDNWSPWSLVISIISSVISFTIQLNGSDRCYQTGSWLGWSGHARQHAGHVNIMG